MSSACPSVRPSWDPCCIQCVQSVCTFFFCTPWGNIYCSQAAGKVQIVYKALFANCSALSLCLPLSFYLSAACLIYSPALILHNAPFVVCGILTAVTSMLNIQADRVHPYTDTDTDTQVERGRERERESARVGWTFCLAANRESRPLSCRA